MLMISSRVLEKEKKIDSHHSDDRSEDSDNSWLCAIERLAGLIMSYQYFSNDDGSLCFIIERDDALERCLSQETTNIARHTNDGHRDKCVLERCTRFSFFTDSL